MKRDLSIFSTFCLNATANSTVVNLGLYPFGSYFYPFYANTKKKVRRPSLEFDRTTLYSRAPLLPASHCFVRWVRTRTAKHTTEEMNCTMWRERECSPIGSNRSTHVTCHYAYVSMANVRESSTLCEIRAIVHPSSGKYLRTGLLLKYCIHL